MVEPSLDNHFSESWAMTVDGAQSRRSACHTPCVATMGTDGIPQQRVMVLRAANQDTRELRFHTDIRAHKVNEITASDGISILAYDVDAKVQLRLSGTAKILTNGEGIDTIWKHADRYARRCYLTEAAPGSTAMEATSGLPDWVQGIKPDEEALLPARANFAILLAKITRIEWLYLATTGHRRARWDWNAEAQVWDGRWLVP